MIIQTAAEYHERYKQFLDAGNLAQGEWNAERDGRHIACVLGVLGDEVDSASKCPATVMPRWLALMVPWFFDNQTEEDAFAWGLAFTEQLARLNGNIPFSVVYDWQAKYVTQMGIDAAIKRKGDPTSHQALQALHARALTGEKIDRKVWYKALRDAYTYPNAYPYAYANANANAYADAYANAYAYAKKKAISILANGLVECLSRVQP